jgi:hypothetical protein
VTAPAPTPVPHSRWAVRENVGRLGASHAEAAEAISALHTAADAHRDRSSAIRQVLPPLRQRLAMRRDWPSFTPLAAACAAVASWLSLWLVLTSGTQAWAAVIFALALALTIAVALMTSSYLGGAPAASIASQAAGTLIRSRPPRRLRSRHRRARSRLDHHTRQWMAAAHRYAVTIPGTGRPEELLARLLADDAGHLALDGLDPFDVMILSALRNYHPAVLAADLGAAAAKLVPELNSSAESG